MGWNNRKLSICSSWHKHLVKTRHTVTNTELSHLFDVLAYSAHVSGDIVTAVYGFAGYIQMPVICIVAFLA